jgi:hypothetical protein
MGNNNPDGSSCPESKVQIKEEERPVAEKRPAMKRSMSHSETKQRPPAKKRRKKSKKLAAPTAPAAAPLKNIPW